MKRRTTFFIRRRWIAAGLALALVAIAWLARAAWLPLLPAWAEQVRTITNDWGEVIQTLADALAILVLFGGGLAAVLGLRQRAQDAATNDTRTTSPLRQVMPQACLKKSSAAAAPSSGSIAAPPTSAFSCATRA